MWQAWHLRHWVGYGGGNRGWLRASGRRGRRACLRGRRGTWQHLPSLCVASVALMPLGWLWWCAWFPVDAVVAVAVGVAAVALGDIDLHFEWQPWHLATWTCILRGRRGTCGTGLAVTHTIFDTPSFTHHFVTHHLSHTTLSLTILHTPSFTHHLSHTTLSHTIFDTIFHTPLCHTPSLTHHLSHTVTDHLSHTIFHIPLCHTPSFTTQSFTHNFVTHHLSPHHLSHTILSHTIFHTQRCHTLSFTHNFHTHHLSHTTLLHTIFHI